MHIDGLGEKTLIPLQSMSRRFNRWKVKTYIERSRRKMQILHEEFVQNGSKASVVCSAIINWSWSLYAVGLLA